MDAEVLAKKASCRVPAEQGDLQKWTKHRLTAANVHVLWPAAGHWTKGEDFYHRMQVRFWSWMPTTTSEMIVMDVVAGVWLELWWCLL